jgi:hypothetical protein
MYVDFMSGAASGGTSDSSSSSSSRPYEEAPDMTVLKACVDRCLADHNAESKKPMPLVMFPDAVEVHEHSTLTILSHICTTCSTCIRATD